MVLQKEKKKRVIEIALLAVDSSSSHIEEHVSRSSNSSYVTSVFVIGLTQNECTRLL